MKPSLRRLGTLLLAQSTRIYARHSICTPHFIGKIQSVHPFHTNGIFLKQAASTSEFHAGAETAAEWHDAPTVSTTYVQKGNTPFYGVYWGDADPMNTLKQHQTPGANIFHASIEGVLLALRQAIFERKLTKVIVRTDSEYLVKCANVYLKTWRENGYMKRDGSHVKNKEELKDFDQLLNMIDAKIELSPSSGTNIVLGKLTNDQHLYDKTEELLADTESFDSVIDSIPSQIVFVRSIVKETQNGYNLAGYGIRFKGKPSLDIAGRFAMFPTEFRTQMYGIIKALQQAKDEGLTNIRIITDSPYFIHHYKNGWKKSDGNFVANEEYYKQIVELAKEVNATFSYSTNEENEDVRTAALLAQDGLSFPVSSEKGTSNGHKGGLGSYMETFLKQHEEYLQKTAEEWKDVRRIHAVSHSIDDKKKFGAIYDQSSETPEISFSSIDRIIPGIVNMLIPFIEKEIQKGTTRLAIRTTEKRMPLILENYLDKWEKRNYKNSAGADVKDGDVYKKYAELKKKIAIRIETFDKPEVEADTLAVEYCKNNIKSS